MNLSRHQSLSRVHRRAPSHSSSARQAPAAAPACRALPVWLMFLPWNGCDAGGFYSTGVKGEPGKPCQEVYQPAAQAEERLRQGLAALQKKALQSREDLVSIIESNGVSQPAGAPAAAAEPDGDERLSSEARRFLKDELLEQQRARTKELVDAAWQSLE